MASMRLASEMAEDAFSDSKRTKPTEGGPGGVDLHNCPPSRVVHVRGLPEFTQSNDLTASLSVFGLVNYVMMMKNNRQALVEMGDIAQATAVVRASSQGQVYMGNHHIFVNFSRSQEIQKDRDMGGGGGGYMDQRYNAPAGAGGAGGMYNMNPSHILMLTVLNPLYPITTEVLFTICSPFGKVLRIVIIRKHGVQGMVEFDKVESAMRARDSLHNADVYPGCCTLKVEFSRTERLNVRKNDDDTYDYTFGMGGGVGGGMGGSMGGGGGGGGYALQPGGPRRGPSQPARPSEGARVGYGMGQGSPMGYGPGPMGAMPGASPVLMIYGLSLSLMNCDRLFNLLCMYGNVVKIKFLPEKPGTAMAQMSDGYAAEMALEALNNAPMFGSKLEMRHSKHPFIAGIVQLKTLPDGTPTTVEYGNSKLNRFLRPDNKNRLYPPSTQVHFFNAPIASTPESIAKVVADGGAPSAANVKIFDKDLTRPSTGMLEYNSVETAVEAAAILNHLKVPTGEGDDTITFKLCFAAGRRPQP